MKILVGTDHSAHSSKALQKTRALALELKNPQVTVIYVYQNPSIHLPGENVSGEMIAELEEHNRDEGQKALEEADKYFSKDGIAVELLLKKGNPGAVITRVAAEGDYDLIVVGSRGLSGVKKLFLGSTSNAVVQEARTSVLVVK